MSEKTTKSARKRWLWIAAIVMTLVFAGAIAWFVRSAAFADMVRRSIIAQIEDATGGRVDIASFDWKLSKLEFDLHDITIHGLEGPNEVPYIHADRIFVRGKVGSLFHRALGFRYFELDRPIVHIVVYPDGTTNQPHPKVRRKSADSPVQPIFDFSINKADIRDGKLLINNESMPLDFGASDLEATMTWFKPANRYDAKFHAGKLDTHIDGLRPFAAVLDAEFSLWPRAAELESLTLVSGKTRIEANGHLDDFRNPSANLRYRAAVDVADTAAILRLPQLRAGLLNLEGRANLSGTAFTSAGKLSARGVEWSDALLHIRNGSISTDFSLDPARLSFPRITGNVLGGTLAAQVAFEHLCGACEFGQKPAQQEGTIKIQVAGLSAKEVAAAFARPSLPLPEMNPAGRASGTIGIHWKGSVADTITDLDLSVAPSPNPLPGELPVSAVFRAVHRRKTNVLEVANMSLTTPTTHATGSGAIGHTSANIKLSANTTDLDEFRPLLAAAYGVQRAPIKLQGQASFQGTISGLLSAPLIDGELQATNFQSDFQLTAGSNAVQQMHWDQLSAGIQYGSKILAVKHGILRRDSARIAFEGSAQLQKGDFTPDSPFTLQLAINDVQANVLQVLAGCNYPVSGLVDLNMQFSGTRQSPHGAGHFALTNANIYGQPVDQIKSDINFFRNDVGFENIAISERRGRIVGAAKYNFDNRAFRFSLTGANLPLEDLNFLQRPQLRSSGTLSFKADGEGTPDAPTINADLNIADLIVAGERAGQLRVQARTGGEFLHVLANSSSGDAGVDLTGTVHMRGDFQSSGAVQLKHADLGALWIAYSKGRLTGRPSLDGKVAFQGPLRDWRKLQMSAEISSLFLPVENMQVRNSGPLKFALADQTLNFQQFHLTAEDTDITANGTLQLTGDQKVDLRAEGRVNLKLIQTMNPDFSSYGEATINVRMAGDSSNPRTVGRIQIVNAGIASIDLPNGLSDINGSLSFNRDRIQVQNLTARTGGGTLNLSGYLTYGKNVSFNLQASGNDIRLRYPQGVSSSANANLRFTGSPTSALLSGDVVLTKFGLTPQFDLATYIARSKQPSALPRPDSMLYNVKLDVHVTSTPELQVQTALAKVSGNVDLRLRGSAARPAVLGRVNIVEGDVSFQGTKYHVERGDITFANPSDITPIFDIAATTRVRDYDISLGFHGSTDRLTTTYRSDPPLGTADIIALLAFGRTRDDGTRQAGPNEVATEQASNVILGQALNATVSSRMQKLFGVSRIKIDPYVGGAENNPSTARVTIEQQVAKDLTVTYITDLTKSNQQIISMEYNVSRKVSIVAVRDQYGILSFDVRVRHRRK